MPKIDRPHHRPDSKVLSKNPWCAADPGCPCSWSWTSSSLMWHGCVQPKRLTKLNCTRTRKNPAGKTMGYRGSTTTLLFTVFYRSNTTSNITYYNYLRYLLLIRWHGGTRASLLFSFLELPNVVYRFDLYHFCVQISDGTKTSVTFLSMTSFLSFLYGGSFIELCSRRVQAHSRLREGRQG